MNSTNTLIFIIFFSISIILFYKYFQIKKKINNCTKGICTCTDTTYKTTYHNNIYIYYYTYKINKKTYNTKDEMKYKLPLFNPHINDNLDIYIDNDDPNISITPLNILKSKIYLFLSILCLIIPFLALI